MRTFLTTTLLGALFLSASLSRAQTPEEEEQGRHHFRLGQVHYEGGHFLDAAHEFEESYRLSQRPQLLQNIYVAYRDAGDLRRAADALRRYLDSNPSDENVPMLRRRLAALEESLANGGGEAAPTETESQGEATGHAESPAATSTATNGGTSPSPVGFIVAGIGGAMAITGAITGGVALSTEGEIASNCPGGACPAGYEFEGRVNDLRALAITTDVLLPIGLAAAAAGVVLIFVLQDGGGESTTAGAACTGDGCMAVVGGRF